MRRVVVTGMGGVTSLGQNWETVKAGLLAHRNAVRRMHEWDDIEGLNARLGAPVLDFTLPEHYTRKRIRSMGRVSLLSTRATELALEQAAVWTRKAVRDLIRREFGKEIAIRTISAYMKRWNMTLGIATRSCRCWQMA